VGILSQANGRLTNSFISQCAPYFAPYYFAKIVNDYSGSFLNPHFGTHGAVLFFGGGHAATNDNTLAALVLGPETCSFRRMVDPSPIFGSASTSEVIQANTLTSSASFMDPVYAEYLVDGKPASPHSYGSGDVIGPTEGGAAHGSFIRVITSAAGYIGTVGAEAAHQVNFASTTGPYSWQRVTDNHRLDGTTPEGQKRVAPPNWTVWVASQNRIYIETRAAGAGDMKPSWFDRASNTWVTGTGAPRLNDAERGDVSGAMFHIPQRNLLVFADCKGGNLRLQYLVTTSAQPSWTAGVVLSKAVKVEPVFTSACWCEDNNRILVGELFGDNKAIVEIEVPTDLKRSWGVTRVAFGTGQSIPWATNASYKKWSYNPKTKTVCYFPRADFSGVNDLVYVYRPRNT
jgi:hypothetical protein